MNKIDDYEILEVTTEEKDNEIIIPKSESNDNNTYETNLDNKKLQIKIYSKSADEIKKFRLKYKAIGAAKKYSDSNRGYDPFFSYLIKNPLCNTEVFLVKYNINIYFITSTYVKFTAFSNSNIFIFI